MHDSTRSRFAKLALHLVIAEDQEEWSEKLMTLAEPLRQWPLGRAGRLDLSLHKCGSVAAFKVLVESLLDEGGLVYATLDLKMPRQVDDQVASEHAGKEMINWCLERKKKDKGIDERLEFCLISELEDSLDALFRQPTLGDQLQSQGVKRIFKSEILRGPIGKLMDIVNDIQSFVRRHITFCSIELPSGGRETVPETVPVWFGGREPLLGLLGRADRFATTQEVGVFVLFADAGGYEVDWVSLCCSLRGLRLQIRDIYRVDPEREPEWSTQFHDPPEALLVRNIDYANHNGCEIASLLEDEKFFDKVREQKSLVFFQFPFFETQLSVSRRLDEIIEVPILDACLRHVYGEGPPFRQGIGFAFEDHRRIVTFPSFGTLRSAGVIRNAIEFQSIESSRQFGCDGVGIDPELFEVMVEMPWDKNGGLQQLRQSIRNAYRNFASGRHRGDFLTAENFKNSIVAEEFRSELGFLVRGRRLYNLLKSDGGGRQDTDSEPEQALRYLEILWQLYDSLDRLRQLRDEGRHLPADETFTLQDYDALHEARSFLDQLFESPQKLRLRINRFRSHRTRRDWKHYYPTLETRRGWAAVENIRFSWPFTRLHLHPTVYAYLKQNGVSALIHTEIDEYLERYPDLKGAWKETEDLRKCLSDEIQQREEERESAEEYMRESQSQPVLVHLLPRVSREEPHSTLGKILTSFLIFNSSLALAENHYFFSGTVFRKKSQMRDVLGRVELGPMIGFLCDYTETLKAKGEASNSVFHRWEDNWAVKGRQQGALRLASQLVNDMLSSYPEGWAERDQDLLQDIAQLGKPDQGCRVRDILELFRILRNRFKHDESALEQYGGKLRDLMRRLVAATTGAYRLGKIASEGSSIDLWSKERREGVESSPLMGDSSRWEGRLVIASQISVDGGEADAYKAMFPVDDLIRVREEKGSLWGYYKSKSIWMNLTHYEGSGEAEQLSAAKNRWLPNERELVSSELWKSVHDV